MTFRVWAPHASSISVPGTFNGWNTGSNPLVQEGTTGVWSADVPLIGAGYQYKYFINGSLWRADPRSREIVTSDRNSVIHDDHAFNWNGDSFARTGLTDLVVYEMHAGTFYDPNPTDTVVGTLLNATGKLDHLVGLGVNAVELMPLSDYPTATSWGYNPAYPFSVANAYGGPAALSEFVKACHARNIAVFLDVVHNHWGPGTDLQVFDGWTPDPAYNGIYFYDTTPECCTPWGATRPNYDDVHVHDYILDTFHLFIDSYHLDGFRWDTPFDMIFTQTTNGYQFIPGGLTMILDSLQMMSTQYPGRINIAENIKEISGFDSYWDTAYQSTLAGIMSQGDDNNRDMNSLATALLGAGANVGRVIFTDSHDTTGDLNGGHRFPAVIDSGNPTSYWARKRSTLAAALTLTAPGVPMLFQGQEMLETQQFSDTRPVDWTKTNAFSNIVQFYKDALRLRKNADGISQGLTGSACSMLIVDNTNKLIAYRRWDPAAQERDVVVIANVANAFRTNYIVPMPAAGIWYTHLNGDATNYGADYANFGSATIEATGTPASATINIGPYSALVLSRIPRALVVQRRTLTDPSPGNGDGFADPAETLEEMIVLQNTSSQTATGIVAVFEALDPGVTVLDGAAAYPDIGPGGAATNSTAFRYRLARTLPCGSMLMFRLVTQFNGIASTTSVARTVGHLAVTGTASNDLDSADVPVAIFDNTTVFSDLAVNIPGNPVISKVAVDVRLNHTWDGDLAIALRHPDGTEVMLANRRGGSGDNFGTGVCGAAPYAIFDDDAGASIVSGSAPFAGLFRPETALSAFDGKPANGSWQLRVQDAATLDQGTVLCWRVSFNTLQQDYVCVFTNHAPVALPTNVAMPGGIRTNFLLGGYDPDSDPIVFQPLAGVAHGIIANFDPTNGTGSYTPIYGFNGTDTLTFVASDGLTSSAPVVAAFDVAAPTDSDGDGMPDAWELLYFGDPTNAAPNEDSDGDGISNLNEYRAHTLPKDSNSFLQAVSIRVNSPGGIEVAWPSAGSVRYRVEYIDLLGLGQFVPLIRSPDEEVDPDPPGMPSVMSYIDPAATNVFRLYRIRTLQQ